MPERGLVANLRNACPSTEEMVALGAPYIRSLVYGNDDVQRFLPTLPPGVKLIALLNHEHEEVGLGHPHDYSAWEAAIQSFCARFAGRVWGVEITNEWDAVGLSPRLVAMLVHVASPYLQRAGMKRIIGGVVSPSWRDALLELAGVIDPADYDYANVHPYGQRVWAMGAPQPGYDPGLAESVRWTSEVMGKPVIVTEFGAKIRDYGATEARQAEYVIESYRELDTLPPEVCHAACYFAYHDKVGADSEQGLDAFGLVAANGDHRPAYVAFQSVSPPPDACAADRERVARVAAYANTKPYRAPSRKKLLELIV